MAKQKIVVTGGAGFIGANTCARALAAGYELVVIDNLSRKGSESNLEWLQGRGAFCFHRVDVRDFEALRTTLDRHADATVIIHLAAQVAVTTSILNPREDFEINALGTFNLLESVRLRGRKPLVIYASTNKVYGGMEEISTVQEDTRYRYRDLPNGISESTGLDFHSPYGCSKGTADQYVRDYGRIYGLPTVVFRQSCIYGPRQFGVEDQGWVAWFIIAAMLGKQISIYGDGKQVRDILFVDDLVDAYFAAIRRAGNLPARVYNVGGGKDNALSVWAEFGPLLEDLAGKRIPVQRGPWRAGDQPVFISDISKIEADLGWRPRVTPRDGITRLFQWVRDNLRSVEDVLSRP